jgi:hypothetical protein
METKGTGSADLGMPPSANGVRSRRNVLAMLGAGGAAAVATLFSRDQAHAGHDSTNTLHLGEENFAPTGQETEVNANVDGFGFRVNNNGASGEDAASGAVQGHSDAGVAGRFTTSTGESLHCDGAVGIFGDVEDNLVLVENFQAGGNGISGTASGHYGVEGNNVSSEPEDGSAGVVGVSSDGENYGAGPGTGVAGGSGTGTGVQGFAPTGIGVSGNSSDGTGVRAFSENGTALSVQGKAAFANAGSAQVGAGQSSAFVNQDKVTAYSHVTVTLTSDAAGRSVSWVNRDPGNGFTVHLTKKGPAVGFTFLVVEPG